MIFTPGTWKTKARAVLNTRAKRCHIPLFFYSRAAAPSGHPIINALHIVPLDVPEGRGHLTGKTMAALQYSLKTYGNIADWFLKSDDDTSASVVQFLANSNGKAERFRVRNVQAGLRVRVTAQLLHCSPKY